MTNANDSQDKGQQQQQNDDSNKGQQQNDADQNKGQQQGQQQNQQPSITQAQLDEIKAEYEGKLTTAQDQIDRITALHESLVIKMLPTDQQEDAKKLLEDARNAAAEEARTDSLSEKELTLTARELAYEYSSYGVTADDLLEEENGVKPTPADMRVRALTTKAAFLENGGKAPVNPANLTSDKGGGGAGGGAGAGDGRPQLEGKGDKAVLAHFADLRKARQEARSQ